MDNFGLDDSQWMILDDRLKKLRLEHFCQNLAKAKTRSSRNLTLSNDRVENDEHTFQVQISIQNSQ